MQKAEIIAEIERVVSYTRGRNSTSRAKSILRALCATIPGGEAALMALVNEEAVVVPKADWDDMKLSVVAFGAPWAVSHARDHGLPKGHLAAEHYDILKKAGARMDAFTRAATPYTAKERLE